jgi:hypothetical protein
MAFLDGDGELRVISTRLDARLPFAWRDLPVAVVAAARCCGDVENPPVAPTIG